MEVLGGLNEAKPFYDIRTRHSTLTSLFLQRLNVIINLST